MPRITIKDIAKAAGVSRGTVDRALNGRGDVDPVKRENILRIAKEIGYEKNVNASSLASNKWRKIALVLPNDRDPFWEVPLRTIESQALSIHDYGFEFLYFLFDPEKVTSFSSALEAGLSADADAIVTAPLFTRESQLFFQIAMQNDIPVITFNTEVNHSAVRTYIGQNSFQAGLLSGKLFHLAQPSVGLVIAVTIGGHRNNAKHIEDKISGLTTYFEQKKLAVVVKELFFEEDVDPGIVAAKIEEQFQVSGNTGLWFTNSKASVGLQDLDAHNRDALTIIGFDLTPNNLELLKEGKIDILLNQKPEMQAEFVLKSLMDIFVHDRPFPKRKYLPVDIVVAENADSYQGN